MTDISLRGGGSWANEHRTIKLAARRFARLCETASADCAGDLAARQTALSAFIDGEVQAGATIAVLGSGWSQSELYRNKSTMLDTNADSAIWSLPEDAFKANIEDRRRYVMVSGGTKVATLMAWLEGQNPPLSLFTAGSHKGQSVAGMLATGSHGSMLRRSGFEGHVRGLLLATAPGNATWLASEPVLRDEFVDRFAVRGDPELFSSALVHLGAMGFISAVLLEVEDDFRLGRVKRTRVLPANWAEMCASGDFRSAVGGERPPDYYEVTLDPFRGKDHEALETIWYRNDRPALTDAPDPGEASVLDLISAVLTEAGGSNLDEKSIPNLTQPEALPVDVPKMTWKDFRASVVDEPDASYRLSQLVGDWKPHTLFGWFRIDVYNAAFAVPLERLPEALDIGFALGAEASRFERHYVFTVRFAQRSPADMGFLRFENNAVINIDGLSKNVWGSTSHTAAQELARRFEAAGLPFSMHWGKDAPSDAAKILRDFGMSMKRFIKAREALLGGNCPLFTSPALEHWGLA